MLENLLKDEKIVPLTEYLEQKKNEDFNIFKVLRLQDYEVRHSNFLAWLFDPKASHGLGTNFLETCLQACFDNEDILIGKEIKVETEYPTNEGRRIDILIHSENFVCVIENKYGSEEHNGQCKHYKEFIENEFKDKSKKFIFLDIHESSGEQFDECGPLYGYKSLTYNKIYKILEELNHENKIQSEIIKQYAVILREKYENIDNKIFELCKDICFSHKDKIEFLRQLDLKSLQGISSEAIGMLQNFLGSYLQDSVGKIIKEIINTLELTLLYQYKQEIFRCIPKKADIDKISFSSYPDVKNGQIIILAFNNQINNLSLELLVLPCDEQRSKDRAVLCETIKKLHINNSRISKHTQWWKVIKEEIISENEYYEIALGSNDEIRNHIEEKVKNSQLIKKIIEITEKYNSQV